MRNLMLKAEAILCAQAAEAACVILHASNSIKSGSISKPESWPVFVKPVKDKVFVGFVLRTWRKIFPASAMWKKGNRFSAVSRLIFKPNGAHLSVIGLFGMSDHIEETGTRIMVQMYWTTPSEHTQALRPDMQWILA